MREPTLAALGPGGEPRGDGEARDAQGRPQDLAPLEEVPPQGLEGREDEDPEKVREALDALAVIEDESVAKNEVVRVPEGDVRVVLDELEDGQDPGDEGERRGEERQRGQASV